MHIVAIRVGDLRWLLQFPCWLYNELSCLVLLGSKRTGCQGMARQRGIAAVSTQCHYTAFLRLQQYPPGSTYRPIFEEVPINSSFLSRYIIVFCWVELSRFQAMNFFLKWYASSNFNSPFSFGSVALPPDEMKYALLYRKLQKVCRQSGQLILSMSHPGELSYLFSCGLWTQTIKS